MTTHNHQTYFRPEVERMNGYQPGFQPREQQVVKLNTNENPFPPSPRVLEALGGCTAEQLRRYPPAMGDGFRAAAAALHGLEPDHILCCNGGDDLLTIAIRSCCDRERPLAYPVPTYSLYPVLARLQGCPVEEHPFAPGFALPDGLRSSQASLTIVCNPNAPTGSFVEPDEVARLAEQLRGRSLVLVDEAYVDFARDSCVRLVTQLDNLVILRSLSKGYSLAGIRFGYAIAQPHLIEGLTKVKDSYNVDVASQMVATAAVLDQEYHKACVAKVKAERCRLTRRLRELGIGVLDSETNFLLASPPSGNAREVFEQLEQRSIYVRYFALAGLEDKLRISVGTPEENDVLLQALAEVVAGNR